MTALDNRTARKILSGLRSRYPVFYLQDWDEDRMERLLQSIAHSYFGAEGHLEVWSATSGFGADDEPGPPTTDPVAAVARVVAAEPDSPRMVLFKDLPLWFEANPALGACRTWV